MVSDSSFVCLIAFTKSALINGMNANIILCNINDFFLEIIYSVFIKRMNFKNAIIIITNVNVISIGSANEANYEHCFAMS